MRRLLRFLIKLITALVLLVVLAVIVLYVLTERRISQEYTVTAPTISIPADQASIERGRHLTGVVSICVECHKEDLGGGVMMDNFAMGRLYATNLTRGRGGIGSAYTDADWVRLLLHGVKPDGRSAIFMPSQDYHFTERDLGALIAYVKSVPPVDRELPPPRIGPMPRALSYVGFPLLPAELIDHTGERLTKAIDDSNQIARGDHLIGTAGCRGCHAPDLSGGAGPPPGGANLTSVGLAGWTEADFIKAIRERQRPNGTTIDPAMPAVYAKMTDDELRAIWAYLKTLPARGQRTKNQM